MEFPIVLMQSVGFFLLMYLIAFFKLFRKWSLEQRGEGTSCFISIVHGTPTATLAALCLLKAGSPWEHLARKNTSFENSVLEFSLAYFLIDLPHYLIFFPKDYKFIAHHVATLFVMGTCRFYVAHGACTIMFVLFLAEITSACQNIWTLSSLTRFQSLTSARIYDLLSPFFYTFYTVSRCILAPILTYNLGVYYSTGIADHLIPRWLALSWVIIVAIALLASFSWVLTLWVDLFRTYSKSITAGKCSGKAD